MSWPMPGFVMSIDVTASSRADETVVAVTNRRGQIGMYRPLTKKRSGPKKLSAIAEKYWRGLGR